MDQKPASNLNLEQTHKGADGKKDCQGQLRRVRRSLEQVMERLELLRKSETVQEGVRKVRRSFSLRRNKSR